MSLVIATPLMVVGCGFALKTIIKMVQTASLLGMQALGRILAVLPDCVKGRITCGTVYGDMVYLDLLGTINCERYLGGGSNFKVTKDQVLHGLYFQIVAHTIIGAGNASDMKTEYIPSGRE